MIFKDNLVLNASNGDIYLINLINFRKKKLSEKHKYILNSIIKKNEPKYTCEEIQFIDDLVEEKQILTKEQITKVEKFLIDKFKSMDIREEVILPNIIITYRCNCNCIYCFQKDIKNIQEEYNIITKEHVDNIYYFYTEILKLKTNKYIITLTGGEPLLPSTYEVVNYIINRWENAKFIIITNGINIPSFINNFPLDKIYMFKISLDGIENIHDQKRPMFNNMKSFHKVINGIHIALQNNIRVDIKTTLDRDSILYLPKMLDYLESKGWLNNPLISIGISSTFEFNNEIKLDDEYNNKIDMMEKFNLIKKQDSRVVYLKNNLFYGFELIRKIMLKQNNQKFLPSIFRCEPLIKPNYTFDPSGSIYLCSSLLGREDFKLGTYFPNITINHKRINNIRERNVLSISSCLECSMRFVCSGGCPSAAYIKNKNIMSCDCGFYKDEYIMSQLGELFL